MAEKRYRITSATGYDLLWAYGYPDFYNWAAFDVTFTEITSNPSPATHTFSFGKLSPTSVYNNESTVVFTKEIVKVGLVSGYSPDWESIIFEDVDGF